MTNPDWMKVMPEAALRGAVAETIRYHDLSLLNGIPEPHTTAAIADVGKMVVKILGESRVAAQVRVELLAQLLDAGLSPDARFGGPAINGFVVQPDGSGRTSLVMLCGRNGFPEGMRMLLERGADVVAAKEDYDSTVVDMAIGMSATECLKIALEFASLQDFYGLKYLARDGSQAPFMLLEYASITVSGSAGDNVSAVKIMLEAGMAREGLLARAIRNGHDCPELIDVLVEYGCDVNEHHFAPAITAAKEGKVEMLQRLFELGADPTAKTPRGASLLQCAGKHAAIKEMLLAWKTSHAIKGAVGVVDAVDAPASMKKKPGMVPL